MSELRYKVIAQYKQLLYMGRDYPRGYTFFRNKLHAGFMQHADLVSHEDINARLRIAEYIQKEIEALYHLKKYRTLKKHYYRDV
ncbi:growth hormone-inducible soluble protein-like protein [Lipomyces oligophaga]|uniref:growth hormone-inducible soluble protein-like protein n=1 Tax=Lipomyces oligophaga TaxID=45792 RepID=UPI0034CEEA38